MSLAEVRKAYGPAAKRGARIEYTAKDGTVWRGQIKSARGIWLQIIFSNGVRTLHPAWGVRFMQDNNVRVTKIAEAA